MTRDHDIKRAIRARMKATGEPYTVARSALVAPDAAPVLSSETSQPQGDTMAAVQSDLLNELDERGFAVLRSFFTTDEVARLTGAVDEVVAEMLAEKQGDENQRRAAGETGWIDVWRPHAAGVLFKILNDRADVAWLLNDQRVIEIVDATTAGATLRDIGIHVSMPGYGHEGFHPDRDAAAEPIGSWRGIGFIVMLSSFGNENGTIRALPGSHRTRPDFVTIGSAMPPHPEEVRIDGEPGDVFAHSTYLWRSETFNGGLQPRKGLWM